MDNWTCTWSLAGVWLVKTGPGLLDTISFPEHQKHMAHLVAAAPDLRETLHELFVLAKGECPGLFDEDSGGDAGLSIRIEDLLSNTAGAA